MYKSEKCRVFHEVRDYFSDNAWEKEIIHYESNDIETAVIVVEQ